MHGTVTAGAAQLAGPAVMTAAGAGVRLAASPGAAAKLIAPGCLALLLAPACAGLVARRADRREPTRPAAEAVLEQSHPGRLPAAALAAARRYLPALAEARGQDRAWPCVHPSAGPGVHTRLCRAAAVFRAGGAGQAVPGDHTATDPAVAAASLAHEAGSLRSRTWRALPVIRGGRPRCRAAVLGGATLAAAAATAGFLSAALAPHAARPPGPPRLAACVAANPVPCYGQDPVHEAYRAGGLYARGITGAGTTIAVVIPDAGPWAARDLAVYDRYLRLPAARLEALSYDGARPGRASDPATGYWEQEGALDLEMAHFMAPGARLAFVGIPVPAGASAGTVEETAMDGLAWLAARQRVDVASFSWGLYEADLARSGGYGQLTRIRAGLQAASAAGVSVIAGSGDSGPAGPRGAGWYRFRTVAWPTSDPLVTGVAAATARITPRGTLAGLWTVRRDSHGGVGGGGLSAVFPRPDWQDGIAAVTGNHRGVPDITMSAAMDAYIKVPGVARSPGWITAQGTSISAALLAGLAAEAAQLAGHPLGPLNPLLYQLRSPADGITDITAGTNTDHGIIGYLARPGYDLASGIGTVGDAALFVPALARLDRGHPASGEGPARGRRRQSPPRRPGLRRRGRSGSGGEAPR